MKHHYKAKPYRGDGTRSVFPTELGLPEQGKARTFRILIYTPIIIGALVLIWFGDAYCAIRASLIGRGSK
jgi:hypothetical protein